MVTAVNSPIHGFTHAVSEERAGKMNTQVFAFPALSFCVVRDGPAPPAKNPENGPVPLAKPNQPQP